MRILLLTAFLLFSPGGKNFASYGPILNVLGHNISGSAMQDSTRKDSTLRKESFDLNRDSFLKVRSVHSVASSPELLAVYPGVSLQQYLKGQAPGVYVQEPSGEPGSLQQMYIRGAAMPLLSKRDVYQTQPLVVLDGIPLISDEHPFAFDIQQYDFNRVGTETNLLSGIDMNNIESVEVLKDLSGAALYGPRGANGVIVLTSKQPGNMRRISFNSYVGMVQRPVVTTVNGDYENKFRQRFYDRYTANGRYSENDVYPTYLSDSLNRGYYGPSNWTDSYYRNALVYGINADISGGGDRANFRFAVGNVKSEGVADQTGMDKYNVMFNINIKPLPWLLFSAMVNGTRTDRDRNRNLRDRFSQMAYIPDLNAPLAPNDDYYRSYLEKFDNGYDDNFNNLVQGQGKLMLDLGAFKIISRLAIDYNEGYRDLFYARTLLEGNSYASNYYGFNQRLIFDNLATYQNLFADKHLINLELGQSTQWDVNKYNNAYAYKGVNDFIKINLIESNPGSDNYLSPLAFPRELVYKFLDRTKQNLVSYHGRASYNYDEKYSLSVLLRADASSNAQPTSRWLFSPVVSASWNIKNDLLSEQSALQSLNLRVSAGRLGRLNAFDNFSQGPQYTADIGFTGNLTAPGYNGFAILSRPYSFGWVGYGIPWAYTDQLNLGVDFSFGESRYRGSVDFYTKNDKNQLLGIPSFAEYGYGVSYESGMDVNNTGVDALLSADILKASGGLLWTSTINFNYNSNRLKALPGGIDNLIIGDRMLKVGEPIDQYWLLQNEGIYAADSEVPVINGKVRAFNGIALKAGDPRWSDLNGDNRIDNEDKSLMGNIMPKITGGFHNNFTLKNWSFGLDLYYNLGRDLINHETANRFDFINREGTTSMVSVKEITFWEKRGDYNDYPLYNPWSSVIPYRVDQDLFLENGSFLKLRTLSLGYDLTDLISGGNLKLNRLYVYGSAHNLFTITPYSGQDPELVDYTGYDTGYGMPIPRTYTLGVKIEL